MNRVVIESADTLHGQLQRGLGRGARRAADHKGAGDLVFDCIRRDPRWDRQVEARGLYYARLVVDLELPAAPIGEFLLEPSGGDEWRGRLALEVLTELVRLSRREAAAALRTCAEEGELWFEAVDALIGLGDPALAEGLDELVVSRCDEPDLDWLITDPDNPVLQQWARRRPQIAAALRRRREGTAGAGKARPAWEEDGGDRTARSDSELLDLARRRDDDGAVAAIFELGRRRTPALLDLAEELLPQRHGRWEGALCRALREYGSQALPRARAWARAHTGCAEIALCILAQHGTRQDIPILMAELEAAVARRSWGAAAGPVEGLGRLRAGEAVPLLKRIWTESAYSYLRPRVLVALTRTAPHTAESYAVEALWDCEDDTRRVAASAAPFTDETRLRLHRLRSDPAEDRQVRAAAAERLML
ncbi:MULTISPECIES: hypothetical protein [Thermomonospora]|uniref:HEAT repeat domain-containing protein n=1 Tax=Thermomonospora curvata (strain ATCC 19995 / DSM 43183 / JCM 3096 / KCTC 9072 / NBRC 15933 / NCIMB 10081 / Henssen B9) TaxID=471852 RepID=D1A724_THECD|nr:MULTISPECIES: hypothetical protein [Thermomonospora]ACY98428.1 hypothetical protein Tcur_2883 [Thermomonospora curvata DSM 43183]PKK13578.1 MAG: hypothetical protein BUE48_014050 [Thermomonospora sp. CIF 1]